MIKNNEYNQSPYKEIPEELVDQYSMNGLVKLWKCFFDHSTVRSDYTNWDNLLPGYIKIIGNLEKEKDALPYGFEESAMRVRLAIARCKFI